MPRLALNLTGRLSKGRALIYLLAGVLVAGSIGIPLYSLIVIGPFHWHLQQPSFYEGLTELCILGVAAYTAAKLKRRAAWIVFGVLCVLYARRQSVDVSIITVYLYFEGIYSIGCVLGMLITAAAKQKLPRRPSIVTRFGAGLGCWLLIVWVHSILHLSSIISLPYTAVIVLGAAIVLNREGHLLVYVAHELRCVARQTPLTLAILVAAFFGLFAKAAVVTDFDSLWYGLQLGKTLAPDGSMFNAGGLVAPVYYYPKLYESLLLPLDVTQSTSTLYGVAIFSLFMGALLIPRVWSYIRKESFSITLTTRWTMLFAICVPALMAISVTTKGDAFAASSCIVALLCLFRCWQERSASWGALGLAFAGYAVLARLSALPYATILFVILTVSTVFTIRYREGTQEAWLRYVSATFALGVAFMVLYRTALLAGMPFVEPSFLRHAESYLGFVLNGHIGDFAQGGERIPLISGFTTNFYWPVRTVITQIQWAGNGWVVVLIVTIVSGVVVGRKLPVLVMLTAGICGVTILFTHEFRPGFGADGNYFIVPYLFLTLGIACMCRKQRAMAATIQVLALSSFMLVFLTASWHAGSRPFDLKFDRDTHQYADYQSDALSAAGLNRAAKFLADNGGGQHAIGVLPTGGQIGRLGWLLPIPYEPAEIIEWAKPPLLASFESFDRFAENTGIGFVILTKRPGGSESIAAKLRQYVKQAQAQGWAETAYQDANVVIWRLSKAQSNNAISGPQAIKAVSSTTISVDPAVVPNCENVVATVHWDIQKTGTNLRSIEIWTGPSVSNSKLFAADGVSGEIKTEHWTHSGTRFFLKNPQDGKVLGTAVVGGPACP